MNFIDRLKNALLKTVVFSKDMVKQGFGNIGQFIKNTVTILRPFVQKNKLKTSLIAGAYAGISLAELQAVKNFYNVGSEEQNRENLNTLNHMLISFTFYVFLSQLKSSLNAYVKIELENDLGGDLARKAHNETTTATGVNFIQQQALKAEAGYESINLAQILFGDIEKYSGGIIEMISQCSDIPPVIYRLSCLSTMADGVLYIIGGTSIVAIVLFNVKMSPFFQKKCTDMNDILNKAYSRLYHNQYNQIQICALNAQTHEQVVLENKLKEYNKINLALTSSQHLIEFSTQIFSSVMPVMMEFWDSSKNNISLANIRQQSVAVASFFVSVSNFLVNRMSTMQVSKERILKYHRMLDDSTTLFLNNVSRHFNPHAHTIDINNFTVDIPGEPTVLLAANLQLPAGTKWKLTGDSGLGKSTILKALFGLWPKAKGQIVFPCLENEVGYAVQNPSLPEECTLRDAILYPNLQATNTEISELMRYLSLDKFIEKLEIKGNWDRTLSSGEMKRVSLLKAILQNVKVLFLDEPAAGLDETNMKKIYTLIKERMPRATIIYIEHESTEVEKMIEENIDYLNKIQTEMPTDGSTRNSRLFTQLMTHFIEQRKVRRDDNFCDGYIRIIDRKFVLEYRKTGPLIENSGAWDSDQKQVAESAATLPAISISVIPSMLYAFNTGRTAAQNPQEETVVVNTGLKKDV